MGLKIILQLMLAGSAILGIFLDYIWNDERKRRRGRIWLMVLIIIALVPSIIIIAADEAEHTKEKVSLTTQLNSMKDSLSTIRKIGSDLNSQIEPILNLARSKYPGLPLEDALTKIQYELDSLQIKTSVLEDREVKRKQYEEELATLKKTKPDVNFKLGIVNKQVRLYINFKNKVPIEFKPYLSGIYDEKGTFLKKGGNVVIVDYQKSSPLDVANRNLYFDFFDISNYDLPVTSTYLFRVYVRYRSIYSEIGNSDLNETLDSLEYIYYPVNGTMKPWVRG